MASCNLSGRVPAHSVRDHVKVKLGIDEVVVLVVVTLPTHVRRGVEANVLGQGHTDRGYPQARQRRKRRGMPGVPRMGFRADRGDAINTQEPSTPWSSIEV